MTPRHPKSTRRSAFSLLEILVVIGIVLLLTAVAIPLIRPAFQDRNVREASRQLNAFILGAKATARERNRPVGVWLERWPGNLNQCLHVHLAEIPPPFSGDDANSRVRNSGNFLEFLDGAGNVVSLASNSLTMSPGGIMRVGDLCEIQFDFKGDFYTYRYDPAGLALVSTNPAPVPATPPIPTSPSPGVCYQIYQGPKKTISAPLELSGGVAIDLGFSGMGTNGMEFDAWRPPNATMTPQTADRTPVVIMFSPDGHVSKVHWNGGNPALPSGNIHLLLGKNDTIAIQDAASPQPTNPKVADPMNAGNLQDMGSLWSSIGHRHGSLTTTENYWDLSWTPFSTTPTANLHVAGCRRFASSGQAKGGG